MKIIAITLFADFETALFRENEALDVSKRNSAIYFRAQKSVPVFHHKLILFWETDRLLENSLGVLCKFVPPPSFALAAEDGVPT